MTDPRISRGLERQLESRRRLLATGQRPLGWKAGFGTASAMEKLDLDGPLCGFLTQSSVIGNGSVVDISGWKGPVAEPEVVAWIGEDIRGGEVRSAISAIGPAIELADIDQPPAVVEEILAGNIFHRGVIFGSTRPGAGLEGLEARISVGGEQVAAVTELEELTGRISSVVSHLSLLLADHGVTIRAGDVIICGSVIPPLALTAGTRVEFELHPLDPISVHTR